MRQIRLLAVTILAGILLAGCDTAQPTTSPMPVSATSNSTATRSYTSHTPSSGYTSGYDSDYFSNSRGLFVETTTTTARLFIPYEGNGGGPTQCADGTWSNSSGRGTCSHHGGIG